MNLGILRVHVNLPEGNMIFQGYLVIFQWTLSLPEGIVKDNHNPNYRDTVKLQPRTISYNPEYTVIIKANHNPNYVSLH